LLAERRAWNLLVAALQVIAGVIIVSDADLRSFFPGSEAFRPCHARQLHAP
jgi:hypothetical protein